MPPELDKIGLLGPWVSDLDPVQKWRAARDPFGGIGGGAMWVVVVVALVGVLLAAAVLVVIVVRRHLQRRRQRRAFAEHAEKAGLSAPERRLLLVLVRLSGLKRPDSVFTMTDAFERGAARLLGSSQVAAMTPQRREDTAALLGRLREKLGFQNVPGDKRGTAIRVDKIPVGQNVSAFRDGPGDYFDAEVTHSTRADPNLEVRPETALRCKPGETWQIRYSEEGLLWELSVSVLKQVADRVVLKLTSAARCLNRRRFARIPTSSPAFVASFPFLTDSDQVGPPEFVPGTMTEIAGPGLKLEAPLTTVQPGDKILMGVQFTEGRTLQGLAVVRRVESGAEGNTVLAGEMTGLTTSEVAELIRVTNSAMQAGRAQEAPAEEQPPEEAPSGQAPSGQAPSKEALVST